MQGVLYHICKGMLKVLLGKFFLFAQKKQNQYFVKTPFIECTHCTERLLLSSPTTTSSSSSFSSSPFRIMSRLYLTFAMAAVNRHWVLIESSGGMNTHTFFGSNDFNFFPERMIIVKEKLIKTQNF